MTANTYKPPLTTYCFQLFCIFIFNVFTLCFFHLFAAGDIVWAVGSGALAASSCIVFAKPSAFSAKPIGLLIAYCIAMLSGVLFHAIALYFSHRFPPIMSICAALAVCTSFIIMVLFNIEHPPALGMALVLVLELGKLTTSLFILSAVIVLLLMQFLCRHKIRDLY